MPIVSNSGLDDPILFDTTSSFVGGVNNISSTKLLAENQGSEFINVDIDRIGNAVTRRGTASVSATAVPEGSATIQGMIYFDTGAYNQIVIAKNRKILWYDGNVGSGSWTRESSSYLTNASDDTVRFAQLSDKLYFCDGVSPIKSYNGVSVSSIPSNANAPTGVSFLCSHTNRMFAIRSSEPDTIYVSDLLSVEGSSAWSSVDSFRVGGDGEPITGIASWTGYRLVVFKNNSTFVITTDPTQSNIANWSIEIVSSEIGCVAQNTISQIGANLYWLAQDGVRSMQRILQGTDQEISEPLSKIIDSTIQEINKTYISKASAIYYKNRYILSVPTGSSTTNDISIVYNTVHKAWSGKWTNFGSSQFCLYTNPPSNCLVLATPNGSVLQWREWVKDSNEIASDYQDSGANVRTSLTTREFTFGEIMSYKSLNNIEVQFYASTAYVSISLLDEKGDSVTAFSNIDSSAFSGGLGALLLPFTINANAVLRNQKSKRRARSLLGNQPVRGVQVLIESSSGKLNIQSVVVSAFLDSFVSEEL
jgi:hypothetical protein